MCSTKPISARSWLISNDMRKILLYSYFIWKILHYLGRNIEAVSFLSIKLSCVKDNCDFPLQYNKYHRILVCTRHTLRAVPLDSKNNIEIFKKCLKGRYKDVTIFPVWLRNRLISSGLESVLSHTDKSCTSSSILRHFPRKFSPGATKTSFNLVILISAETCNTMRWFIISITVQLYVHFK